MVGTEPRVAPLPSKIGRHQVVGYIATGGMAELFLGKEATGRPVVIKRILPHLARQTAFVSMFIDEARIGSRAKHPNLVEVYELGQVGSDLFLVMEYLVGENLASVVRRLTSRNEQMSLGLCAYIIAEVCDGLHAAHELTDEGGTPLNLVHRDVSPQNVFVTYGGDVKLLDFGVATAAHRLTQTATGEVKGKYAYMSPEQCRGEALDRRSDIFSLGTVLYELTTQRRLFKRANELQILKAITEDPIPRPTREVEGYPQVLEDICVRALARDPAQRYSTAAEMREDLLRAMSKLGLDGDPHEAIASKFARLFADRMEQKRELLERVRGGGDLTDLLTPEADENVDIPLVSGLTATPLSKVRPTQAPAVAKRYRSRRAMFLIAFLLAVVFGGGIGGYLRLRARAKEKQNVANTAPAVVVAAETPDESVAPPVTAQVKELVPPNQITISIDTDPEGVNVIVGGVERGKTPVEVKLDKGTEPVDVQLLEPGFATAAQEIVPDRDQRLYFQVIKQQKAIVRVKRPGKGKRKGKGFRRFD
jgi:eukaryotic-like serine/threonine-protein kinase